MRIAAAVYRFVERAAWTVALVAALCVTAAVALRYPGPGEARVVAAQPDPASAIANLSDWHPNRVRAWRDSLKRLGPPPLASLRIPRIGLEVAVLEGTDDWTLNRAIGHIVDTPKPGSAGNVGLAGHRDGFFRGLKDIAVGDLVEVETGGRVDRYVVQRMWIVDPTEVSVLDATESPAVTLVTCYPFYFIGSAPQRFIVRALREAAPASAE